MQIRINSNIFLQAKKEIISAIKKELTMKNPAFMKKRAIGIPTWGEPEKIMLWKEKEDRSLELPRGYFSRLWNHIPGLTLDQIEDKRVLLPEVEFPVVPELRHYQLPALKNARDWQQGVILMPCGAGKTETGMGIIANLRQPTLWVTHTLDLLNQSKERAEKRLGLTRNQIGVIQGNNHSIGTHITFATVQTLSRRNLKNIVDQFGCIIIDECHLVFKDYAKARLFESVISQFPAYYRFGLTASEYRSDGLISTMFYVVGPKVYEVTQKDLNDAGNVVVPEAEFISTEFSFIPDYDEDGEPENLNIQKLYVQMREDEQRQKLLQNILKNDIKKGDYCIVLGDSLEHLQGLRDYVAKLGRNTTYIDGKTTKKQRGKIMADMRAGKYQYLFATYQLAKLGLDIPRLNKLVFATPKRDKTSIQQAVGRIMRPFEGKQPGKVYDLWDRGVKTCIFWARERARVYKSLGCEVIGGPRIRK